MGCGTVPKMILSPRENAYRARAGPSSKPSPLARTLASSWTVQRSLGGLYLNDGQALAPYLGSRKGGWVNVVGAKRVKDDAPLGHAVIQANQILMAWSPGAEIAMAGPIAGSNTRAKSKSRSGTARAFTRCCIWAGARG